MKSNNGTVELKKVWLYIIVISAIGSPFLAFATIQGKAAANTENIAINRNDIKAIETVINNPKLGIAALNAKIDIIIDLVEKIESRVSEGQRQKNVYHNP